jgi:TonB family protein
MQVRLPVLLILLLSFVPLHADNADDLQKHLQDRFLNKIFMIRNFYGGTRLVFDSKGNLLEGDRSVGYQGCWSAAEIKIRKLEVTKDRLILRGPRVFGVYDPKTKEISQLRREHQEVEIEVQLDAAQSDEDAITGILAKVFLTRDDDLGRLIPFVWAASDAISAKDPGTTTQNLGPLFRVGQGVTAPKPIHTPDPGYSEEARKAKYQGDVNLWCVVGPNGNVAQIKINQCLGLGLDEQSIRALSTWKFAPATKDGQPVAVQLNVTMNFHLY